MYTWTRALFFDGLPVYRRPYEFHTCFMKRIAQFW